MLIQKETLDFNAWNNFVSANNGTIFSTTHYLNACAENWMVYWDKKASFGIALPYTLKFGVKTLYQPFFSRYQEYIGQLPTTQNWLSIIKETFKRSLVAMRSLDGLKVLAEPLVYQEINPNKRRLSTNAKRKIKQAQKNGYTCKTSAQTKKLELIIEEELHQKQQIIKPKEILIFKQLIAHLIPTNYLKCIALYKDQKVVGGLFYLDFGQRIIYLKGACKNQAKQNGGMYLLLNSLIEDAQKQDKIFDFGGSRVGGVRNFNIKLGGIDKNYYSWHWDNSPIWFKLAQRIKNG